MAETLRVSPNTVHSDDTPRYRETCVTCGMVANLDPSLHHQRYKHLPRVNRNGVVFEFSYRTYSFSVEVKK